MTFYQSTIGKKIVMAVSGLILLGFLVLHLAGNLLVFAGPGPFNRYAATLKALPELVWMNRVVLLVAVILHIDSAYRLTRLSHAARPVSYARTDPQAATLASRTMRWGGVLLLLFIIFHLLHFTTGTLHPSFLEADVYGNVMTGFRVTWVALFYVVAMGALGMHLFHGASSMFQSLGLSHPAYNAGRRTLLRAAAVLLAGGFASIPLAVWLGWLR